MKSPSYVPMDKLVKTLTFSLLLLIGATYCSTAQAQSQYYSSGWQPVHNSVQWKVNEYGSQGNEVRYFFNNKTQQDVWVKGNISYTNSKGLTRNESFNVKVKANSKRGGQWNGFVFFTNSNPQYRSWRMDYFLVSTQRN